MKKAIYSLIASTLILTACGGLEEPKRTSEVEPISQTSVVPWQEHSTINFTYPYYSRMGELTPKQEFYNIMQSNASSVEAKEEKSLVTQVAKVAESKPKEVADKPKEKKEVKALSVATAKVEDDEKKPNGTERVFTLTAYTSGVESTGKSKGHPDYGKTASGTIVKEGRTASCPKNYEFGTQIYIPSLETTYTCEDRGGAIKGNKLDIYIADLDRALEFGRKKNVVGYVLD